MNKGWLGIFSLVALCLSGCENSYEKVKVIAKENLAQAQTAKNVEILYSSVGVVRSRVLADVVERHEGKDPYMLMPAGVKAFFLDSVQHVTSTLRANQAKRFELRRVMEANGNVIVNNEQGDTLHTEQLIWEETKDHLYSDRFVRITTKTEILEGTGLSSNQTFTKWKILHPTGIFSVKKP